MPTPDWARSSGDLWARRWKDTDAALAGLSPHLAEAIRAGAPSGPFKAFELGCGPGSTTLQVADTLPQAEIAACDISAALARIARDRLAGRPNVRILTGDAQAIAPVEAPFDLIFSRHGVMFFDDPVPAFAALRASASRGARFVFSCFRDWDLNDWACDLASTAAGRPLPPPGREPGGFAFADAHYVRTILDASDWQSAEPQSIDFRYVAGSGDAAVERALEFLAELGPAARVLETLPQAERSAARDRMRRVIERHAGRACVAFPAAAWIWTATAR